MRMNKQKCLYEAPTADILVVRFGDAVSTSYNVGINGFADDVDELNAE